MSKVLVSIVCTNYNKGDWIAEAIDSFLRQKTKFEYEILLIDDKSTDHSVDIIRSYAKKHSDKIRAFYNKKNLGITKTWIRICKEARGKYIARCDGDDYWIDEKKLQKQVELLEKSKDSKWCSTDYNIITPEGMTTERSVFERGLVDRSKSYAEMLATKGFTMSSTWLVDARLMNEINAEIDNSAVDDTFNIQLDLFNKTKLTYLPEPTVVYRVNEGSDSRPIETDKIISRHERLFKTQLEYLDKYKDVDYRDILQISLARDMKSEMLALERLSIIRQQKEQIKQQSLVVEKYTDLINSRKYRVMNSVVESIRFVLNLPKKVVNRVLWLEGRRRYSSYYKANRPSLGQLGSEREQAKGFKYRPRVSIVVPVYNTPVDLFNDMVSSVLDQTYDNWELVLIDDASTDNAVREEINKVASKDSRVVFKFLQRNKNIAGATNEGFKIASGEFIALLDHDDILHLSALFEVIRVVNDSDNSVDFIYTDEDKLDEKGRHIDPFIKPDWNQEFLYSTNYISHFTVIRKSIVDKVGGERSEYNGAQDWDLYLRVTNEVDPENIYHIPRVLYSWRVHDESTAKSISSKSYILDVYYNLLYDNFLQRGFTENQFSIKKSAIHGVWVVSYEGQDTERLHKPGQSPEYERIKGLSYSRSEMFSYFGRRSLSTVFYKNCQYSLTDREGIDERI